MNEEKIDSIDEKVDAVSKKLDFITQLVVAMIPSHRLPTKIAKLASQANTPQGIADRRKGEMLRIFTAAGRDLDVEKKVSQNYPMLISELNCEAVPRAVILNRSAQSKLFAPILEAGELNGMENAKMTLEHLVDEGELFVGSLKDSVMPHPGFRRSSAVVVFSPSYYEKLMVGKKVEAIKDEDRKIWQPLPEPVEKAPKKKMCKIHNRELDLQGECMDCYTAAIDKEEMERGLL